MNLTIRRDRRFLVRCLLMIGGLSHQVNRTVASELNAVQWTTTRHTWGEDLSGSLQGAGGIGGLLRSTVVAATQDGRRNAEHEQTPAEHTFSYDSNGNVIVLTDTQGRESARYAYYAFGKTVTATGPVAQMNRYRFSTKPIEVESGLCYYGYRYYDPVTGRWPSRDVIGEKGGINLYGMLENDLNTKNDVLGKISLPYLWYRVCPTPTFHLYVCTVSGTRPCRFPDDPVTLFECLAVAELGLLTACALSDHEGWQTMCQTATYCWNTYF